MTLLKPSVQSFSHAAFVTGFGNIVVQSTFLHQRIMVTELDHTAIFEHDDPVRISDCGQPVTVFTTCAEGPILILRRIL